MAEDELELHVSIKTFMLQKPRRNTTNKEPKAINDGFFQASVTTF